MSQIVDVYPLLAALKEVVGYGTGIVLSCIPGKLAYFEGKYENGSCSLRSRSFD